MTLKKLQENFSKVILHGTMTEPLAIIENGLDHEARLSVYQRNTYRTLTDFLEASYPKTHALLGKETFQKLAHEYINENPPLTADLDAFSFPFSDLVKTISSSFVHAVADFENALRSCLLQPMPPRLTPKMVELRATENPEHLRFILHPTTHLYASSFPFQNFWHTLEDNPQEYGPKQTFFLLYVVGLNTLFKPLHPGDWVFFKSLESGLSIQESFEKALKKDATFDLPKKLTYAIRYGIFEKIL